MPSTIRIFRHAGNIFRHGMDFKTDEVFLQLLNPDAMTPQEEWVSLIRYDPHCYAWDAKTGALIGHFFTRDGFWVFDEDADLTTCEDSSHVESLLDSEVTISKRWLDQQLNKP